MASKWKDEDRQRAYEMRKEGASWDEIAAAFDCSKESIWNVVGVWKRRVENPMKRRRCMCCRQSFRSKGIHNRLCETCKTTAGKSADMTPYAVGS